ncbi:endo-1,4-beta-xylanase [Streptomyces sp. NPDC047130]|uniref:endo-1,4-beta-xylanase n=1 Tax=Streptomyces sp. NPDC047130 TaxID=3155261 RepID=UPI0034069694
MTWDALGPSRGSFTFAAADRIVNHAEARGTQVRGHALVRHPRLPGRVGPLGADGLREAMTPASPR